MTAARRTMALGCTFIALGTLTAAIASADEQGPVSSAGTASSGVACCANVMTSPGKARLRKLGRGFANILTGPGELLRVPALMGAQEGYIAASTIGFVQGAWRALKREGVGLVEVLTFYGKSPKDFEPIMTPEFVWQHGDWTQ